MSLPANIKAINLGCGLSLAPGWINIDNSPNARLSKYPWLRRSLWKLGFISAEHYAVEWPKEITIQDLRKRLPYPDSSIDFIYTSHLLEHLSASDAQKLVRDVFRLLKPGGLLRVVVPDLTIGARRYLESLQAKPNAFQAAPDFLNWMQLSRLGVRDPHLWMYDRASLSWLLNEIGFANVVVCEHKQGRMPDCDILDNRPDDSLHIEAEKP